MVRSFLVRGMLVGVVAGLLAFGLAKVVGEPQVNLAIAFEASQEEATADVHEHGAQDHAAHSHGADEPELVSREVQSGLGLFTGVVTYGTALGGLFALVFAYAYGRVEQVSPRALAALIAAAGFVAIIVVPDLKYPANPPAVGNPDTIGERTKLYFAMIVSSIATMVLAIAVWQRLLARYGAWTAGLVSAALFIVIIGVVQAWLPDINEVPDTFPAVVLWRFRIATLGIQLVMWSTLGLLFGWLTERSFRRPIVLQRPALS